MALSSLTRSSLLGFSKITGKPYMMGGWKPFNPKTMPNPLKDILSDNMKNPTKTLPEKLIALEDSIEDYCGEPTRFRAEVMGEFGQVRGRNSFRDEPDYVRCMAEIAKAVGK